MSDVPGKTQSLRNGSGETAVEILDAMLPHTNMICSDAAAVPQ